MQVNEASLWVVRGTLPFISARQHKAIQYQQNKMNVNCFHSDNTVICHTPVEYITSQLLFIFCICLPILNGIFLQNCMTSLQQKHVLDRYSCYVVSTGPVLSHLEVNPLATKGHKHCHKVQSSKLITKQCLRANYGHS